MTLFLHSPLTAICVLGKIKEIPYHLWETGQAFVDRFLAEASRLLTRAKGLGIFFLNFSFLVQELIRTYLFRRKFLSAVFRRRLPAITLTTVRLLLCGPPPSPGL